MKGNKIIFGVVFLTLIVGLIAGFAIGSDSYSRNGHFGYENKKNHEMKDGKMMMGESHDMSMEGMMEQMSSNLLGKTGDAFDRAFLEGMIPHHLGAVEMAKLVLQNSKRPELLKLANDIISAQNKEIQMMTLWKNTWFKTSAPVTPTEPKGNMVACTMEAKSCGDGTYVGRQGPNCEFAPCPGK